MKRKVSVAAVLAGLQVTGCVTTHVGKESVRDEFTLSCAPYHRYSTDKIKTLSCVFENRSKEWRKFEVEDFTVSDGGELLSQERTKAFEEAVVARNRKEDHNVGVALLGLAAVGVVAMAAGGDSAGTAGAGAVLGAGVAGAAKDLSDSTGRAQHGVPKYGPKHMMAGPFEVPPELHVTRYVVVELDRSYPNPAALPKAEICLKQPVEQCVQVDPNFKYKSRASAEL